VTQPSLFDLPTAPSLVFMVRCPTCGAHLDAVPVEGDVNSWNEATQWGYLAQQNHNLAECPEGAQHDRP
jgi:hypothetical protein